MRTTIGNSSFMAKILEMNPEDEAEEDCANIDINSQRKGKCVVLKISTRQPRNVFSQQSLLWKHKLKCFQGSHAAGYTGVKVELAPNFEMGVSNRTSTYLKLNPIGRIHLTFCLIAITHSFIYDYMKLDCTRISHLLNCFLLCIHLFIFILRVF